MKVTIKNENKSTEIKYPCLMKHRVSGIVVLFISEGEGAKIYSIHGHYGEYYDGYSMEDFTPFTGTIELSND